MLTPDEERYILAVERLIEVERTPTVFKDAVGTLIGFINRLNKELTEHEADQCWTVNKKASGCDGGQAADPDW